MAPGEHEIEQGFGTGLRAQLEARRDADEPAAQPEAPAAAAPPSADEAAPAEPSELDEVDALRFERLVGEGRALADADPAAASLVLG